MANSGGVNRTHDQSFAQKLTFAFIHALIVAICFWLAFAPFNWPNPERAQLLAFCALLYWLRHCITLFVLLKRQVEFAEVFGLSLFMAIFEIGFLLLGAGIFASAPTPFGLLDVLGIALLLVGSLLNSGSELQRWQWKKQPSAKGHCYTDGLFAHSMHINYFGDSLLFIGWAILAMSIFAWIIPFFVTLSFIIFHIPALDEYLAKRYGDEFEAYAQKTAKFVPYLY